MTSLVSDRDEYLEAALKTAARLYWLIQRQSVDDRNIPLDPEEKWLSACVEVMRQTLREAHPLTDYERVQYQILRLLGVVQSVRANSRYQEQA